MKKLGYLFLSFSFIFFQNEPHALLTSATEDRAQFDLELSLLFTHPEISTIRVSGYEEFRKRLESTTNPQAARVVLAAASKSRALQRLSTAENFSNVNEHILRSLDAIIDSVHRDDQAALFIDIFKHFSHEGRPANHIFIQAPLLESLQSSDPDGLSVSAVAALRYYLSYTDFGGSDAWWDLPHFSNRFVPVFKKLKLVDSPEKLALMQQFYKGARFQWNSRRVFIWKYTLSLFDLIFEHPEPYKRNALAAVAELLEVEHNRISKRSNIAPSHQSELSDDEAAVELVKLLKIQLSKIQPLAENPSLRYDAFAEMVRAAIGHSGAYLDRNGETRFIKDGEAFVSASVDSADDSFQENGEAAVWQHEEQHFDSLKAAVALFKGVNRVMNPIDLEIIREIAIRRDRPDSASVIAPIWITQLGVRSSEAELLALIKTTRGERYLSEYEIRKSRRPEVEETMGACERAARWFSHLLFG